MCVLKPSVSSHASLNIREHILEKSPMNVPSVGKSSMIAQPSLSMSKYTLERSPMNVTIVKMPLSSSVNLSGIREFILEKSSMSVLNVVKVSGIIHPLFNMRKLMGKKVYNE
jgi:hypothetical protein